MKADRLVIVDGIRTPFSKFQTDLARLPADELGRIAVTSLLTRTGIDPDLIDEVILGCVCQPVESANVARVIALRSGIPERVPAVTVHRNCASGMEAVTQAHQRLAAGRGSVFLVGGVDSMSQAPLLFSTRAASKFIRLQRAKTLGQRLKAMTAFRPVDFKPMSALELGLTDPYCGLNMGQTAEVLARECGISREDQDAFALESHQKSVAASENLEEEICPIYPASGTKNVVTSDNGPRPQQSIEALARLKPVFERSTGSVTAGNASQITDGAVALLVMAESRANELGLEPLGALVDYAYAGCDPERMGLGPVHAMAEIEARTDLRLEDADLIEINEAFGAQVLAVLTCAASEKFARKHLGRASPLGSIDLNRLNVNGGSIALGHPVGATGARLILTSLKELKRRNKKRALVSACVGGGQGAAIWLETL